MFNVRLAGGHLYGKQLSTWLSLVVSLMASFVLSFFPPDVLEEIWDLIESVSEGFLTYSFRNLTATVVALISARFYKVKECLCYTPGVRISGRGLFGDNFNVWVHFSATVYTG